MPRRPRIHIAGVPLHILQRGNGLNPCFHDKDDYQTYLDLLGESLLESGFKMHAFILMPNHVHLLLTPRKPEAVAGLIMAMGRRYVQYINRRYERSGNLWESRYRSSLIEPKPYLIACQHFIEQSPVRSGLVKDAARYRWSSYRANALGEPNQLISPHPVYEALGRGAKSRQAAYRTLMDAHPDTTSNQIRMALIQNQPLGSARFYARIEKVAGERREPRPRGRPRLDPPAASAVS